MKVRMEAGIGGLLVAGSRREFVVLNVEDFTKVRERSQGCPSMSCLWFVRALLKHRCCSSEF